MHLILRRCCINRHSKMHLPKNINLGDMHGWRPRWPASQLCVPTERAGHCLQMVHRILHQRAFVVAAGLFPFSWPKYPCSIRADATMPETGRPVMSAPISEKEGV